MYQPPWASHICLAVRWFVWPGLHVPLTYVPPAPSHIFLALSLAFPLVAHPAMGSAMSPANMMTDTVFSFTIPHLPRFRVHCAHPAPGAGAMPEPAVTPLDDYQPVGAAGASCNVHDSLANSRWARGVILPEAQMPRRAARRSGRRANRATRSVHMRKSTGAGTTMAPLEVIPTSVPHAATAPRGIPLTWSRDSIWAAPAMNRASSSFLADAASAITSPRPRT